MKEAELNIISAKNKELLDGLGISYYRLQNSKSNTIAFTSCAGKTREFELEFMSDGTYRIGTKFLGYRAVMEKEGNAIKKKDPDQQRYLFRICLDNEDEVNELIAKMLKEGYSTNPKCEYI